MKIKYKKLITISISIVLVLVLFTSGCEQTQLPDPEQHISDTGRLFAKELAQKLPYRSAYSLQEKQAAKLIFDKLEELGYDPVITEFGEGENVSANISVLIPGQGFIIGKENEEDEGTLINRQVIVGAHYDTIISADQWEIYPAFDGINDNASGVGALISVAEELTENEYGYDILLVFFGARYDDMAGAKIFAESMNQFDINSTDVMYNIESIYAGDKLYAHSGVNSLEEGKKYLRRRKLYELSDVAIANQIDLRFNESDLDVDVNGDGQEDVYREVSLNKSNYSVFDEMNIPCVFIESFEYFASTVEEQIESKNPYFNETDGMIRGTNNDSVNKLEEILENGRLEMRIKNTAFLIVKAIEKGIYIDAITP